MEDKPCIYCGVPADSMDHVPPRAARDQIAAAGLLHRYPFFVVDSCRECNSILSNLHLWTIQERKEYVKKALMKKYAKYLRIPSWNTEELSQFSDRSVIGTSVKNGIRLRDLTKQRLRW